MNIRKIIREAINETIRDPKNIQKRLNSEVYEFANIYAPVIFNIIQNIKKYWGFYYKNSYGYNEKIKRTYEKYSDFKFEIKDIQKKLGWFGLQYNKIHIYFDDYIDGYAGADTDPRRKTAIILFSPFECQNLSLDKIKQLLIHELTHILDWADYRHDRKQNKDLLNKMKAKDVIKTSLYLFNKTEIEARIQEAVESYRQNGDLQMAYDVARIDEMKDYMEDFSYYIPSRKEFIYSARFFGVRVNGRDVDSVTKDILNVMSERLKYIINKLNECLNEKY